MRLLISVLYGAQPFERLMILPKILEKNAVFTKREGCKNLHCALIDTRAVRDGNSVHCFGLSPFVGPQKFFFQPSTSLYLLPLPANRVFLY